MRREGEGRFLESNVIAEEMANKTVVPSASDARSSLRSGEFDSAPAHL
jgi:hypothetical protein